MPIAVSADATPAAFAGVLTQINSHRAAYHAAALQWSDTLMNEVGTLQGGIAPPTPSDTCAWPAIAAGSGVTIYDEMDYGDEVCSLDMLLRRSTNGAPFSAH
jgi:hypothetical protein